MPKRKVDVSGLSVADLKRLLNDKKAEVKCLRNSRRQIVKELKAVDAQLAGLQGGKVVPQPRVKKMGNRAGGKTRTLQPGSITAKTIDALTKAGKPLTAAELIVAVGYKGQNYQAAIKDIVKRGRIVANKRTRPMTYTVPK